MRYDIISTFSCTSIFVYMFFSISISNQISIGIWGSIRNSAVIAAVAGEWLEALGLFEDACRGSVEVTLSWSYDVLSSCH